MKRILVIIALCSPLLMQAQSIEHILKSIEQNNKELKAQKHAADATKMENRTNNNMPDPTVSYSSFYSNGAEGNHKISCLSYIIIYSLYQRLLITASSIQDDFFFHTII